MLVAYRSTVLWMGKQIKLLNTFGKSSHCQTFDTINFSFIPITKSKSKS